MSLLAVLAMAASLTGADCAAFAAGIDKPAIATAQAIPGEALGGKSLPFDAMEGPRWTVGALLYRGYGIALRSDDVRFRQLVADPERGVIHPCGYGFSGPGAGNALDKTLSEVEVVFQSRPQAATPPPGATAARTLGAMPVLAGYKAGSSWPIGHNATASFIGLMHPENGDGETLIVAFAARQGASPARVLARLPLRFDTLGVVPDLHRPSSFVNLAGVDAETGYRHIVLTLSDAQVADIAQGFRP